MQAKKYYLILVVILGSLCVPALSQVESALPEDELLLIGREHPELAGIKKLYLHIDLQAERKDDLAIQKQLHPKIENILEDVDIDALNFIPGREDVSPVLRINVDVLRLDVLDQYVFFNVWTSLSRAVTLANKLKDSTSKQSLIFKADVWKTKPVMKVEYTKDMPAKVTEIVLKQVESFINAWKLANPKGIQPTDANSVSVSPTIQAQAPAPRVSTRYIYVASKNSKVFHKPQCTWAKRIAAKNLIKYRSRNDAINDGRRPCKICKP